MVPQAEPSEELHDPWQKDRVGYFSKLGHQCSSWWGRFMA